MFKSILWKEWREQRWKLAFGTVMLLFFTGVFLAARVSSNQEISIAIWIFGGLILALYSAMGIFAPEQANGTLNFLAAKPISPWKVFLTKWLFGWLNIAIPMLACTVLTLIGQYGNFQIIRMVKGLIAGLGLATMFYTLVCCLAPRKGGEATVGFSGLLIFLALFIHLFIFGYWVLDPLTRTGIIPPFYQQALMFLNPVFWTALISPLPGKLNSVIQFMDQGILFLLVMGVGYRKWRRSV